MRYADAISRRHYGKEKADESASLGFSGINRCPRALGNGACQPSAPAQAATALFDRYCLSAAPEFARLDREASTGKYQVVLDRTIPMGKDGQFMHQKNWLVATLRGKVLLKSEDTANGPLHVFGCGLAVIDGDATDLEPALSANPRLGKPVKRVAKVAGTAATVWWQARIGDAAPSQDWQVMMASHLPGISGVMINLIYRTHLDF